MWIRVDLIIFQISISIGVSKLYRVNIYSGWGPWRGTREFKVWGWGPPERPFERPFRGTQGIYLEVSPEPWYIEAYHSTEFFNFFVCIVFGFGVVCILKEISKAIHQILLFLMGNVIVDVFQFEL